MLRRFSGILKPQKGQKKRTASELATRKEPRSSKQAGQLSRNANGFKVEGDKYKAHLASGRASLASGQMDAAVQSFSIAWRLKPHKRSAILEYAKALRTSGRPDEAAEVLETAVAREPGTVLFRHLLGWTQIQARRPELAILTFEAACAQAPDDAGGHHGRGVALRSLSRLQEAVDAHAKAYELDPSRLDPTIEYSRTLAVVGRLDEAAILLEQLAAKRPEDATVRLRLGTLWLKAGKAGSALTAFEQACALAPGDAAVHQGLGNAFRALGRIDEAIDSFSKVRALDPTHAEAGHLHGLALADAGRFEDAARVLGEVAAEQPDNPLALLRFGNALLKVGRPERALSTIERAARLAPLDSRVHRGRGAALRGLARIDEATRALETALQCAPEHIDSLIDLAELKEMAGARSAAFDLASKALTLNPMLVRAYVCRTAIHYARGDIEAALEDCNAAISIQPDHHRARLYLDLIKAGRLLQASSSTTEICILETVPPAAINDVIAVLAAGWTIIADVPGRTEPETAGLRRVAGSWRSRVAAARADYILTIPASCGIPDIRAFTEKAGNRVGVVGDSLGSEPALWRRDVLQAALELYSTDDFAELTGVLESGLQRRSLYDTTRPSPAPRRIGAGREVWLASSSGIQLFGGVEHYLRGVVPIYRGLGFRVIVLGVLDKMGGAEPQGVTDGIEFINIARNTGEIRRLALQRSPAIVHSTTGVGYEVAAALEGLSTRVIYGSHFWRDMFHGNGSFENIDFGAQPRLEFGLLCTRADQTYSNSTYTREMIAERFGISQPVVYSVPPPVRRNDLRTDPGGAYVLLMNARPEKGLNLVLALASRLRDYPFRVVATQVSRTRVEEMIDEADASNVEVIDWSRDTAALYRGARVVLVPSHRFIETFSRVTIEAQRYGVPVIGSDRGNVKLLLADSGVALPEDIDLWCAEIEKLFRDDAYWRLRSLRGRANADRYPYSDQRTGVRRLVRSSLQRIGVGVGSGIGNIIQCSPAIRRIAEYFGAPVDILLREDFPGCRSLFDGSQWVGSVIPADRYASISRFDAVLLFDCFGTLFPHLNAETVLRARERYLFSAMRDMHEAKFNLICAEELLGVPYRDEDASRSFVGATEWAPVARRIGIHAGCKDGEWLPKRWPYFKELAESLKRHGFEVLSFGGRDELVEGTKDATGTDLATTIRNIASCSYFVSNDSGLMHVADAVGVPLTSMFAPTTAIRSGPLGPSSRAIQLQKDCSPCVFDRWRMAQCKCMRDIKLETVESTVLSHLAELDSISAMPNAARPSWTI